MRIKATKTNAAQVVVSKKTTPTAAKKARKTETREVVFTVHAERGKNVFVAGEFNNWDPTAKKMAFKVREGIYTASMKLAPGDYQYKFVIDGTWCADPENVNAVANDRGTFNSVITVA